MVHKAKTIEQSAQLLSDSVKWIWAVHKGNNKVGGTEGAAHIE